MSREIPLTRGKVAVVDDEDYDRIAQHKWYAEPIGRRWYACRRIERGGIRRKVYMHREVVGAEPGTDTDHRDHDGLNNRRGNLRSCTRSQNCANIPNKAGRSRFKGVQWITRKSSWQARIRVDWHSRFLGWFETEEEAALAYNAAALAAWGEFAKLNEVSHV